MFVTLLLLGEDDSVFEKEHSSPMLCTLNESEVALPKDPSLLYHVSLGRDGGEGGVERVEK